MGDKPLVNKVITNAWQERTLPDIFYETPKDVIAGAEADRAARAAAEAERDAQQARADAAEARVRELEELLRAAEE